MAVHLAAVVALATASALHGRTIPRTAHPLMTAQPPAGGNWLSSLLGWAREAQAPPEALVNLAAHMTRPSGFALTLTLGSEPARSAGGTGTLAKGSSSTVVVACRVVLAADEGFDPLCGDVELATASRYLRTPPCFWSLDYDRPDAEVPSLLQLRLGCAGIATGGDEIVPAGETIFLNARVEKSRSGAWDIADGTCTVKEEVGLSRGILSELKIVGTFKAVPEPDAAQ